MPVIEGVTMSVPGSGLLTPVEAATVARCSIKTVRRAYTSGALVAYRRCGSRAVLLDHDDVLAWVRGQLVRPTAGPPLTRANANRRGDTAEARRQAVRRPTPGSELRLDLSAQALHAHRGSRTDCEA